MNIMRARVILRCIYLFVCQATAIGALAAVVVPTTTAVVIAFTSPSRLLPFQTRT